MKFAVVMISFFFCHGVGADTSSGLNVCYDETCDGAEPNIPSLLQTVQKDLKNAVVDEDGEDLKKRDNCPYAQTNPIELDQIQPWNVTAELPKDLLMKHSGWTSDGIDRGVGVFALRAFKKGEDVGSALARVAPCADQAYLETPMGVRAVNCDIHFFDLPSGSANSDDDLALFPSWMSFVNEPDDENEAGLVANGNVEWGTSICNHPSGAPQWRLLASQDIAPQMELTLVYDGQTGMMGMKKKPIFGMMKKPPPMTMMKGMKKG